MKKLLIACFLFCLIGQVSFAEILGNNFGLSINAKTVNFTGSIGNLTANANADNMYGLGLNIKVPIKENQLCLLLEGEYNTSTSFTASGVKTDVSAYPLEINLQDSFGFLYIGGGANYTLWNVSSAGNNVTVNNGIGYQGYVGLGGILADNINLELKYTHMAASITNLGVTADLAGNTLSLGAKIWII